MGGCLRKPRSPPFVDCITEYARANPAQVKESWAIFEDVLQKKPTLNEEEFDTVFGLLCGDGERHFQVFVEDGLVDSYEALCAIVLCLRIQFKHKVDIILTYCGADARGYSHARSFVNMLRKCAGGMHRLVGLPMPDAVDFELVNAWFEKEGPLEEVIVGGDDVARWVADDRSVREYVERTEQIVVGIVGSAVDVGGTLLSGALMVAGRAGTTCVDHVAEAHSSDGIPLWDMPLTQLANRSWWETIPTWSDNTIVIKMLHVFATLGEDYAALHAGTTEANVRLQCFDSIVLLRGLASALDASVWSRPVAAAKRVVNLLCFTRLRELMPSVPSELDIPLLSTQPMFVAVRLLGNGVARVPISQLQDTREEVLVTFLNKMEILRWITEHPKERMLHAAGMTLVQARLHNRGAPILGTEALVLNAIRVVGSAEVTDAALVDCSGAVIGRARANTLVRSVLRGVVPDLARFLSATAPGADESSDEEPSDAGAAPAPPESPRTAAKLSKWKTRLHQRREEVRGRMAALAEVLPELASGDAHWESVQHSEPLDKLHRRKGVTTECLFRPIRESADMETPIERYCCVAMSTLQGVAEQMVEYSVETIFVVDAAWRPVSYVTSQDILQAVAGATDERMDMHEHDRG